MVGYPVHAGRMMTVCAKNKTEKRFGQIEILRDLSISYLCAASVEEKQHKSKHTQDSL